MRAEPVAAFVALLLLAGCASPSAPAAADEAAAAEPEPAEEEAVRESRPAAQEAPAEDLPPIETFVFPMGPLASVGAADNSLLVSYVDVGAAPEALVDVLAEAVVAGPGPEPLLQGARLRAAVDGEIVGASEPQPGRLVRLPIDPAAWDGFLELVVSGHPQGGALVGETTLYLTVARQAPLPDGFTAVP